MNYFILTLLNYSFKGTAKKLYELWETGHRTDLERITEYF